MCNPYNLKFQASIHIKCTQCDVCFREKKELNKHYEAEHHIQLEYEKFNFESVEEFEKWKKWLQRDTVCQFSRKHTNRTATKEVTTYICHRSGMYRPQCGTNRKRRMKLTGSKRIGGRCPAEIVVSHDKTDHSCVAKLQKIHVGHEVGTISELKHTYFGKEEKLVIAAKLSMGVTSAEVLTRQKQLEISEEATPFDDVYIHDVGDVSQTFETDEHQLAPDALDLDAFIIQNSESVLYFKDKSNDDEKYGLLDNADLMIVIMDSVQEETLCRHGHKIVAFDSSHGASTDDGYFLYTLLVINMDFEGFPVAFALTNRNDYKGVSVFLKCIKDKVGVIKTRSLMSDMQPTCFSCWSEVMQPPERHLYCMWHVYDQWKKNFKKISNLQKKKEVKEQLFSLATETDVESFELNLQLFLLNVDDETKDFIEYFNKYALCREKWACCYRSETEMNTNMYLERFRGRLKKNAIKGKEMKSITSCLKFLFEYLKIQEKDYLCRQVRGKVSSKFRTLRCRHKTAEEELSKISITIQRTSSTTWLMGYLTNGNVPQDVYTIKRRDIVECTSENCALMCDLCGVCFHQYKCTCQDSNVQNNMCKHIHVLGIIGEFGDGDTMVSDADGTIVSDVGLDDLSEPVSTPTTEAKCDEEDLKEEVQKAVSMVAEALQHAVNVGQVREIIKNYIEPIEPTLKANLKDDKHSVIPSSKYEDKLFPQDKVKAKFDYSTYGNNLLNLF